MFIKRYQIVKLVMDNNIEIKGLMVKTKELSESSFIGKFAYPYSKFEHKYISFGSYSVVVKEQINPDDVKNFILINKFITANLFDKPIVKCFVCKIFKHKSEDFSNNGLSSKFDEIYVLDRDGNIEFDILDDNCPENIVGVLFDFDTYKCIPLLSAERHTWYIFGGTFVYTSNINFRSRYKQPVPLYDRTEN